MSNQVTSPSSSNRFSLQPNTQSMHSQERQFGKFQVELTNTSSMAMVATPHALPPTEETFYLRADNSLSPVDPEQNDQGSDPCQDEHRERQKLWDTKENEDASPGIPIASLALIREERNRREQQQQQRWCTFLSARTRVSQPTPLVPVSPYSDISRNDLGLQMHNSLLFLPPPSIASASTYSTHDPHWPATFDPTQPLPLYPPCCLQPSSTNPQHFPYALSSPSPPITPPRDHYPRADYSKSPILPSSYWGSSAIYGDFSSSSPSPSLPSPSPASSTSTAIDDNFVEDSSAREVPAYWTDSDADTHRGNNDRMGTAGIKQTAVSREDTIEGVSGGVIAGNSDIQVPAAEEVEERCGNPALLRDFSFFEYDMDVPFPGFYTASNPFEFEENVYPLSASSNADLGSDSAMVRDIPSPLSMAMSSFPLQPIHHSPSSRHW